MEGLHVRAHVMRQGMKAVEVPIYDFTMHQRSSAVRRVEPADVVIIEGILVLHMPDIRDMLNMKIFVDTDDDLRLARRCVPDQAPYPALSTLGASVLDSVMATRCLGGCPCGSDLGQDSATV